MKRDVSSAKLAGKALDTAAGCFDSSTLEALAAMQLDSKTVARVEALAGKANDGRLTPSERREYQAFVETSEFLALLQIRARKKLGLPILVE